MSEIRTYEGAIELIQKNGFLFLLKNKKGYMSLEESTKDLPWYSDSSLDPWRWKCKIANEKKAAYTRFFSKKHMFISWDWYPYCLAYFRNGWDKDDFYKKGHLSNYANKIYELLEEEKVLPSNEIKKKIGAEKEKTKFENALTELQSKMLITICGESKKRNKNGEPYGWSVVNFTLTDDWVASSILEKAEKISNVEAKEAIYSQIRTLYGKLTDKEIERFIGIRMDWNKG